MKGRDRNWEPRPECSTVPADRRDRTAFPTLLPPAMTSCGSPSSSTRSCPGRCSGFKEPAQHLPSEVVVTVSWKDRSIAYSTLLQGASAQEAARRFRVNTGAVVQWAKLAGMVIRVGARGGIEPALCSEPTPDPQRAYPRLTHRTSRLRRDGDQQHACVVDTGDRPASRCCRLVGSLGARTSPGPDRTRT